MIENKVPGLYYFFLAEEVGRLGSKGIYDYFINNDTTCNIKKIVSFDRRGTNSIITHQLFDRCCSDEFADELALQLNMMGERLNFIKDDGGSATDSATFMDIVPECTNISVGYYNEHTTKEYIDIDHLCRLCKAVVKVDWESLPVKRDPSDSDWSYYRKSNMSNYKSETSIIVKHGEPFNSNNYTRIGHFKYYISDKRIKLEKEHILEAAKRWEYLFDVDSIDKIVWDGSKLYIKGEYIGKRSDICEFIPYLNSFSIGKDFILAQKEVYTERNNHYGWSHRNFYD